MVLVEKAVCGVEVRLKLQTVFPHRKSGFASIATTRLADLCFQLGDSSFLFEDLSFQLEGWNLQPEALSLHPLSPCISPLQAAFDVQHQLVQLLPPHTLSLKRSSHPVGP